MGERMKPQVWRKNESSSSTFLFKRPASAGFRTCGCCEQGYVSADTLKGFPLALWKPSGHAVGGGKTPSGSTGISSAATYGSATDDPVHPAREFFAPTATMRMRRKTRIGKRELFTLAVIICVRKKNGETRDRDALYPHHIPEITIGILSCLSVFYSHTGS